MTAWHATAWVWNTSDYGDAAIEACPPRKAQRVRKMTLARALKQASKVNMPVRGAVLDGNRVELHFGEAAEQHAEQNPWEAEIKKLERSSK
jgi:hypothetical protein